MAFPSCGSSLRSDSTYLGSELWCECGEGAHTAEGKWGYARGQRTLVVVPIVVAQLGGGTTIRNSHNRRSIPVGIRALGESMGSLGRLLI